MIGTQQSRGLRGGRGTQFIGSNRSNDAMAFGAPSKTRGWRAQEHKRKQSRGDFHGALKGNSTSMSKGNGPSRAAANIQLFVDLPLRAAIHRAASTQGTRSNSKTAQRAANRLIGCSRLRVCLCWRATGLYLLIHDF